MSEASGKKLNWTIASEASGKICTFPPNSSNLRSDYLFLSRRGQNIYFQHFQGQNISKKGPAPPPPPSESNGRPLKRIEFEFIGVLCHMQWYFSHICDGTDVQADWRSWTYGRAPNAIDISQGSLTWRYYTDTGHPFYTVTPTYRPYLVAFYDTLGIHRTYSRLKPPVSSRGLRESRGKESIK